MTESCTISIEDLKVDEKNVRGEQWTTDQELVQSIQEQGFHDYQPILVRPLDGGKYGIVAGSRRYNAAIEAGLDEVPCVIKELEDDKALSESIMENRGRKDVPVRQQIAKIKQYFEETNGHWTDQKKKQKLKDEFGFPDRTAKDYISILNLDESVQQDYGLVGGGDNASDVRGGTTEELSTKKAYDVSRHLSDADEEDQREVIEAVKDPDVSQKQARETAKQYAETGELPDKNNKDHDEYGDDSERLQVQVSLPSDDETTEAFQKATVEEDQQAEQLVESIVEDWLERRGYL